jgi:hypothetical protein
VSAEPERLSVDLDEFRLAREMTGSSSSLSQDEAKSSSSPKVDAREPAAFTAALDRVETLAGERLAGWGRRLAAEAFEQSPDGFVRVVDKLLARHDVREPLALLVRMLRDDDHLLDKPDEPSPQLSSLEQRMREKGEL